MTTQSTSLAFLCSLPLRVHLERDTEQFHAVLRACCTLTFHLWLFAWPFIELMGHFIVTHFHYLTAFRLFTVDFI